MAYFFYGQPPFIVGYSERGHGLKKTSAGGIAFGVESGAGGSLLVFSLSKKPMCCPKGMDLPWPFIAVI